MQSLNHPDKIQTALSLHVKPSKLLKYGTAGFRDHHNLPLHGTLLRMGILASMRSIATKSKWIGVMITASHNPEEDNGVKIVDCDGGMLLQSWEAHAESLANATNEEFENAMHLILDSEGIPDDLLKEKFILIGRDTRSHSPELAACVRTGAEAVGSVVFDLGEVTTPQLHFIVQHLNTSDPIPKDVNSQHYLELYNNTLLTGFQQLLITNDAAAVDIHTMHTILDMANGVSSIAVTKLLSIWNEMSIDKSALNIELRNIAYSGPVNENCGAEIVQKNQIPPMGFNATTDKDKLLCSFDGDGDRIIFHCFSSKLSPSIQWIMLDGDKIAALIALFLFKELQFANFTSKTYSLGVVQTAYANGASTQFLRMNGITPCMAKTGVKFVHHKALQYDVGIYFEANGHGTVLFSNEITEDIRSSIKGCKDISSRQSMAIIRLNACLQLINQTVGDSISDMLLCIAILKLMNFSIEDWHHLYTDLPSKQQKVPVKDKSIIVCNEDETKITNPPALQMEIEEAMLKVNHGRCFIRPSGTEDVVRIYAEAASIEEATQLAESARVSILKHLN